MPDRYLPVATRRYQALEAAFRSAPQATDRFAGTLAEQHALAEQIRGLFDDDPGEDSLLMNVTELMGIANELDNATPHWSIGQFLSVIADQIKMGGDE